MATVFISAGSNIDREQHLRQALLTLRSKFNGVRVSPVYESVAVGFTGAPFLNCVIEAQTDLSPEQVVALLHTIENAQQRDRSLPKFSPRTLDLDLLLYDDLVIHHPQFHLPRDEIVKYAFVLAPLADLTPHRLHPMLQRSYADLWQQLSKEGQELWKVEVNLD